MLRAATIASVVASAAAVSGLDVSDPVSASTATCLAGSHSFAVVRAWHSYGAFDTNAPASVSHLWDAGFKSVGVYMFPCKAKDPGAQVKTLVSDLAAAGTKYDRIWLDIETNPSTGCAWDATVDATGAFNETSAGTNCDYIGSLIAAVKAAGKSVGVYASQYEWGLVAGSSCTSGSSVPVWYAHYDGVTSYSDWVNFGGWTASDIFAKQFDDNGGDCGISYDKNWHP